MSCKPGSLLADAGRHGTLCRTRERAASITASVANVFAPAYTAEAQKRLTPISTKCSDCRGEKVQISIALTYGTLGHVPLEFSHLSISGLHLLTAGLAVVPASGTG